MKKILFVLVITLVTLSCKKETPKDYVTIYGVALNKSNDTLVISNDNVYKNIIIKKDGSFSDTLKVKEAGIGEFYESSMEGNIAFLYLKKGDHLKVNFDFKNLNETLSFEGGSKSVNDYLKNKKKVINKFNERKKELLKLDQNAFNLAIADLNKELTLLLNSVEGLDSNFDSGQLAEAKKNQEEIRKEYNTIQSILTLKGKPSPKFIDYENYNGGTTSLDDLKGKYVYIDLWATWCPPCKAEIPFLKKIEEDYHGKNIAFVSISTDSKEDYDAWKTMVKEKEMTGMQLWAKGNEDFSNELFVEYIPRFLLIGPKGNVLDPEAPFPSNKKQLMALFNKYGI